MRFLAHSGDSWFWLIGLVLLWLFGNDHWQTLALVMLVGLIMTALLVMIIKLIFQRQRPQGSWGKIYRKTDPHSFPSGHAARAMMLAVIALGLGPLWLGLILLIWAPLVAISRVIMGVHYFSDVLVGNLLGFCSGLLMLWFINLPSFSL